VRVNEIFQSIQGEGVRVGVPAVFVRLQGCNFFPSRCSYCDTQYAVDPKGGEDLSVSDIVDKVRSYVCSYACISGGEPLLQMSEVAQLVDRLQGREIEVEIETNGSVLPENIRPSHWNVDVKCLSSGFYGSFKTKWLTRLRNRDQLKFVVGTKEDLNFVRGFLNGARLRPTVLVSPIAEVGNPLGNWNREWLQECAEFCKKQNVRFSLQIHKLIWGNKKGV